VAGTRPNVCVAIASVTVLVELRRVAEAGVDEFICIGDDVQLGATGGIGYLWTPDVGLSAANVADPTASPTMTTQYIVTVTDSRNCSETDTVIVTVNPLPVLQTSPDTTICQGASAPLRVTGALNYLWAPGLTLSNPIIANPIATPDTSIVYTVVGTDGNGCVNDAEIRVNVIPRPEITGTLTDSICPFQLSDLSVEGGFSVLWSTGETTYDITVSPRTSTVYWALVFDGDGCPSDTFFSDVFVSAEVPRAFFEAIPNEIFPGDSVTFVDLSVGATQYRWNFGDGGSDTIPSPTHTYLEPGQYTPSLWVDNEIGCPDSIQIPFVTVSEAGIFFPNAFSPNGDNINDFFYIPNGGYQTMEIQIFDRWGRIVFQSSDPNCRWDGRKNGVAVPEGVYVFAVEGFTDDGKRGERTGTIAVIGGSLHTCLCNKASRAAGHSCPFYFSN